MKNINKKGIIVLLMVLVLAAGVAFAAFSDTLTISGTANAKGNFDVEFTSASLDTTNSTGIDTSASTATVSADGNTVTLNAADLEDTSSQAVFNVTVHNASTTAAVLNGITVTYNGTDLTEDLFNVTHSLVSSESLSVDESKTYTVTVSLKDNVPVTTLNSSATFTISLEYGQN